MTSIPINEAILDEKLAALEKVRTWSPRVISKLETTIRTADDYTLFRINPIQYAAEKNMPANEAIDLFLYATKFGLFEMEWHLICPSCAHIVESLRELSHLHSHFTCQACFVDYHASLDDFIQVAFTISPLVRDKRFRHPESLSADDLYFRYHLSKGVLLPNGASFADVMRSKTIMLAHLAPHESAQFETDLTPGILQFSDFTKNPQVGFFVDGEIHEGVQSVRVRLADGKYESIEPPVGAVEVSDGVFTHKAPQMGLLHTGKGQLEVVNDTDEASPLWVWNASPAEGSTAKSFQPFLSGKQLLTTQTFRDLFRTEVVQSEEGIGVKDITFLFTDLKGSTAMYDQIGDPKAYYLVRQHFDTLGKVIAQNSGAIVKTIGDAVMATFMHPVDAVKAAVEMLTDIETFNRSISQTLSLKIGIHRGHSIVVTLNDRLDYFGQTVNIAARVQGLADADEIYITQEAYEALANSTVLDGCEVSPEQVVVKGVSDKLHVHKITLGKSPEYM